MMQIDGSFGEGGGQIIRSSLALAALTGTGVEISNVRAGRKRPGLQRQHLVAVRAATEVCNGAVEGDEIGSTHIVFEPGEITGGAFDLPIGTAGSTSLVMQTVLMPLLLAGEQSFLTLGGGTHNPMAPPYEFLRDAYLPHLRAMGGAVELRMDRAGYYPAGGGRVAVDIPLVGSLNGVDIMERGDLLESHALIRLARLPRHIADREAQTLRKSLGSSLMIDIEEEADAPGPGNAVLLTRRYEHITEVFCAIGERRLSAEQVAESAADQALSFERSGAPVGEHLADQLMLPLALAGRGRYRVACVSEHTRTHAALIQRFLDVPIELRPADDGTADIKIG